MIQNPKTHLNKLKRSATFAINERSDKLANEGKTIYRFGFGQSPFPIPDMVTKTLQEMPLGKIIYLWMDYLNCANQ